MFLFDWENVRVPFAMAAQTSARHHLRGGKKSDDVDVLKPEQTVFFKRQEKKNNK